MKLIGFYNYTVIATYFGFAAAFCGCYAALCDNPKAAFCCLMLAGGFDMIDGRIAATRPRSEDEKAFGIQIDSLCDLVSFGVLPALILWAYPLPSALQIIVGILFTLAAIIRLSYFNVTELNRQKTTLEKRKYYEGMPVTTVALLFPFLFLFSPRFGTLFPWLYTGALLLSALLFLLPFKLKKAGTAGIALMTLVGAFTLFGLIVLV